MTIRQLRLIWGIARRLEFDYGILHRILRDVTGKQSLRTLRPDETHKFITHLRRLAGNPPDTGYHTSRIKITPQGTIIERCSLAQVYTIRFLCRSLNWTETRLWDLICHRFGLDQSHYTIDDLTPDQATQLIIILKNYLKNEH
ncbi:MAG: regulatory protein GemA [candidate division WOR-3 bacterium]|nr:regulatory protein GemA [candidate division WOR-3 bacterium]